MKDDRGNGLEEGWGRFLGLLGGFAHVCRDPWYSRDPRRSLVVVIIRWADARTGRIGVQVWIGDIARNMGLKITTQLNTASTKSVRRSS